MVRWAGVLLLATALAAPLLSARAADRAPDFRLVDIDGNPLNATDLLGHIVVLDFAGTWCEPCKIVEAAFRGIYAEYEAKGVVWISVFMAPANGPANIESYRASNGNPWHLAQDNGVSLGYNVYQIPRFFVIDKKGYVVLDWTPGPAFSSDAVKAAITPVLDQALTLIGPAPAWELSDIDGNNISSAALRGRVTLLLFENTSCTPCRVVEDAFREIHTAYAGRNVAIASVFLSPANSRAELAAYRASRHIPWSVAQDNGVSVNFSAWTPPRFFAIDKDGYVTLDWIYTANVTQADVDHAARSAVDRALRGNVGTVSIVALSIPALLVVAALLSFFSPCSFPVLPAFMTYYLNLDAKGEADLARKPTARTAASRGFIASLGMVTVYGIIAVVVLAAGLAAQAFLPFVSPIVGVLLITFAVLTLLPYQYHFLTRPFIALKQKIASRLGRTWQPGVRAKLFAFGAGYGAAGFACVAPPFIGAVLNASALGRPQDAALGLILYVVIVIVTMVSVVIGLHFAGDRLLKKIRVWSGVIKYVSAFALIIAGAYLLWLFWYSSSAG